MVIVHYGKMMKIKISIEKSISVEVQEKSGTSFQLSLSMESLKTLLILLEMMCDST